MADLGIFIRPPAAMANKWHPPDCIIGEGGGGIGRLKCLNCLLEITVISDLKTIHATYGLIHTDPTVL